MINFQNQKGVSLYIAFMIMTTLLGIALGTSALLFTQIGILRGMGHAVLAFYATEAGVERAQYIDNTFCVSEEEHAPCLATEFSNIPPQDLILTNGASYILLAEDAGTGGCPGASGFNYCVKATGSYKDARRAVRMAR